MEGKDWPVHKLVLFCYSNVLYKMSTNAAFTECQTGRIVLKDVELRCVEAMVNYFYHQSYRYDFLSYTPRFAEDTTPPTETPSNDGENGENHSDSETDAGFADFDPGHRWDYVGGDSAVSASGWGFTPRGRPSSLQILQSSRLDEMRENDQLDFHLGVCMLAECYNIKGLKLAAETEIIEQHLDTAKSYDSLSSMVDKIFDSDAPESLQHKLVSSLIHKTHFLHSTEWDGLLDRRPELAVAILKKIAERRHAKHLREEKDRLRHGGGHDDYAC